MGLETDKGLKSFGATVEGNLRSELQSFGLEFHETWRVPKKSWPHTSASIDPKEPLKWKRFIVAAASFYESPHTDPCK